jgi:hypothetical protein
VSPAAAEGAGRPGRLWQRLAALLLPVVIAVLATGAATAAAPDGVAIEPGPQGSVLVATRSAAPDLRFGERGRTALDGLDARHVLTDGRGFHQVLGQSRGAPAQIEVRRFTPNGHADLGWSEQGRARTAAPAGLMVRQGLQLADGRLLVAADLERMNPQAALWQMSADGRFEPAWLLLDAAPSSRWLSLVPTAGGGVLLGVLVGGADGMLLEVHLWTPGGAGEAGAPERIAQQRLPQGWTLAPVLEQRAAGWFWVDPEAPKTHATRVAGVDGDGPSAWHVQVPVSPAEAVERPHASERTEPGEALYSPWAKPAAAPRKADAVAEAPRDAVADPWLLTLAAGLLLAFAALIARRTALRGR